MSAAASQPVLSVLSDLVATLVSAAGAFGALLGVGLVLTCSPFLWPADASTGRRHRAWGQRLRTRLGQAGFGTLPESVFLALSAVVGLSAAALVQGLLAVTALTAIAGVAGLAVPTLIVGWRARSRRHANRTVWPDVVDHLVSALRSGLALPDSVSSLAHTGPPATRGAFAGFEREYRATGNFAHCVEELKATLADPIADRILETLRMAREVGGTDLTVVLRSLAAWLRQDTAVRAEVEARQSWVVNAARLGVAAPWIILVLLSTRPEAALAYNTPAGSAVIAGGLVVSLLAYRIMIALGRLPEERRWFQ